MRSKCPRHSNSRRARLGFSLVEIMVVVVIIGLLAGLVAVKTRDYVDKARRNRALADIAVLVDALETYYADSGAYPGVDQGFDALPLEHFTDPWSRPYQYNTPGRDGPYEVVCYGADGQEGGTGPDEDLGSWTLTGTSP